MLKIALYFFVVVIVGWIIYKSIYLRKLKRLYQVAFEQVFKVAEINLPSFKTGYTYSYPSFKIMFENEEQLKRAEVLGLTKAFEAKIQVIHNDIKDFEANKAVSYTWVGKIYDLENNTSE